ncbi:50S ribosomal protein L25 [Paenibacillus hunanensis]|uniref:50S ribosomal protein L25 n=1 Tax=Paenibacillus hunanensis TaxID=539262 RepID=UPI002A6A950D|nr:50S ribosomal protein L25 [Paenibacillus hunanensis]WPP40067.1 50S ribosomal protein L25 [Paenibacillus hunanensis]
MTTMKMKAEKREATKYSAVRELRNSGRTPGVVYGPDLGSIPVHVDSKQLQVQARRGGADIFSLTLDNGKSVQVLLKDIQRREGRILHVDFLQVSSKKPITVSVPLDFHGEAPGTKVGGILQTQTNELEVSGLAKDLPSTLVVDVSKLEIGDTITAADVELPDGVELISHGEDILASVAVPRVADEDLETPTASDEEAADGEATAEASDEEKSEE